MKALSTHGNNATKNETERERTRPPRLQQTRNKMQEETEYDGAQTQVNERMFQTTHVTIGQHANKCSIPPNAKRAMQNAVRRKRKRTTTVYKTAQPKTTFRRNAVPETTKRMRKQREERNETQRSMRRCALTNAACDARSKR